MFEHTQFPAKDARARITYPGLWKHGLGITLVPITGNWVLMAATTTGGTIGEDPSAPNGMALPAGTYIVLPGFPGEMPEHAKVFAARRQGLPLRDAGLPILEVAAGATAVMNFDPKHALEAAAALPVAP